jgi:hypothetical protein
MMAAVRKIQGWVRRVLVKAKRTDKRTRSERMTGKRLELKLNLSETLSPRLDNDNPKLSAVQYEPNTFVASDVNLLKAQLQILQDENQHLEQ